MQILEKKQRELRPREEIYRKKQLLMIKKRTNICCNETSPIR